VTLAPGAASSARLHQLLEQHVHEHEHRFRFDHERARRLVGARVEVLVHAVVVHDRHVARLPVVAHAVVHLVALAVEDVERGLVHVPVLLRPGARTVFFQVQVKHLRDAVLRLDVMAAVGLRAVGELGSLPLRRGIARSRASSSFRLYCPWIARTKIRSFLLW
jgi:hypothetical protein